MKESISILVKKKENEKTSLKKMKIS